MKTRTKFYVSLSLTLFIVAFVCAAGNATELNAPDYDQYLVKALKDDNIGIRTSAAQLLGERKVETAIKPLVTMLKTEKNYAARIVAAIALYQIGDEKVLPVLREVYKKDKSRTVKHVVAGIIQSMEEKKYAKN